MKQQSSWTRHFCWYGCWHCRRVCVPPDYVRSNGEIYRGTIHVDLGHLFAPNKDGNRTTGLLRYCFGG